MAEFEYEAFQDLIDALERAASAALRVGAFRPDQRNEWERLAASLSISKEVAYRAAGSGALTKGS